MLIQQATNGARVSDICGVTGTESVEGVDGVGATHLTCVPSIHTCKILASCSSYSLLCSCTQIESRTQREPSLLALHSLRRWRALKS